MPLSNSYGSASSGGVSTDLPNVVVAAGEKIVLVAYLPTGVQGTSVDWGADTDVGTLVGRRDDASLGVQEIWEVNSPAAATRTLTLNYDTTGTVGIGAYVFSGAGPCSDFTQGGTSSANEHTLSVPNTTSADFLVDMVASNGNIVVGSNQTELFDDTTQQSSSKSGALSVVGQMTWTSGVARDTSAVACRVPAAVTGPSFSSGPTVDQITQGGARIRATGDLP